VTASTARTEAQGVRGRRGTWGYIATLDGWRAIAVLMVILEHQLHHSYCADSAEGLICGGGFGGHGVTIFFGLSGLLITLRLLEEKAARGTFSFRGFYVRRAFRILPPAIAFLVLLVPLHYLLGLSLGRKEWFASLLFNRDLVSLSDFGWYTGHFWSLAVEEKFYLLWPAMLALLLKFRQRTLAFIFVVGSAIGVEGWRHVEGHYHLLGPLLGQESFQMWYRFDGRVDGLLWGCALALIVSEPTWRARFTKYFSPPVAIAFLALWLATWYNGTGGWPEIILIPPLILFTALNAESPIGRFFESSAMRWIGRCSYSLYLWQQLFLVPQPRPLGALQEFPLNVIATFVAAWGSYTLLERPFIRVGHRLAKPVTAGRGDLNEPNLPATSPAPVPSTVEFAPSNRSSK
jgi:peptidoglycan/LPS O-acetylase OafA/YrhL